MLEGWLILALIVALTAGFLGLREGLGRLARATGTRGPFGARRVRRALRAKPDTVPRVERELQGPPPRPAANYREPMHREGSMKSLRRLARLRDLQRYGIATTAWVVDVVGKRPVHTRWEDRVARGLGCRYAFEDERGRIVLGWFDPMGFFAKNSGRDDPFAWGDGDLEDLRGWISRHVQHFETFTVLYPPGRPEAHCLYAELRPHVLRDLGEIVEGRAGDEPGHFKVQLFDLVMGRWCLLCFATRSGGSPQAREQAAAIVEAINAIAGTAFAPDRLGSDEVKRALEGLVAKVERGELGRAEVARLSAAFGSSGLWAAQ